MGKVQPRFGKRLGKVRVIGKCWMSLHRPSSLACAGPQEPATSPVDTPLLSGQHGEGPACAIGPGPRHTRCRKGKVGLAAGCAVGSRTCRAFHQAGMRRPSALSCLVIPVEEGPMSLIVEPRCLSALARRFTSAGHASSRLRSQPRGGSGR